MDETRRTSIITEAKRVLGLRRTDPQLLSDMLMQHRQALSLGDIRHPGSTRKLVKLGRYYDRPQRGDNPSGTSRNPQRSMQMGDNS